MRRRADCIPSGDEGERKARTPSDSPGFSGYTRRRQRQGLAMITRRRGECKWGARSGVTGSRRCERRCVGGDRCGCGSIEHHSDPHCGMLSYAPDGLEALHRVFPYKRRCARKDPAQEKLYRTDTLWSLPVSAAAVERILAPNLKALERSLASPAFLELQPRRSQLVRPRTSWQSIESIRLCSVAGNHSKAESPEQAPPNTRTPVEPTSSPSPPAIVRQIADIALAAPVRATSSCISPTARPGAGSGV